MTTRKQAEIRTRLGRISTLQTEGEEGTQSRVYRVQVIPLNQMTEDGRIFESVTWREPPLPLMATKTTSFGHEGAVLVGNLTEFSIDEDWVIAEVRWDEGDEVAADFKRLVDEGFLTSLSADVALLDYEVDVIYDEDGFIDDMTLIVHEGKILGATIVPMPAFEEAGFTSSAAPAKPPKAWFDDPQLERLTPLTVDGDRVYGHLAPWNECHVGIPGTCVTAPRNESGYQLFLAGQIETEEGDMVAVGQLTLAGGHAPRGVNARAAAAHYDDTDSAVADVTVGEDEHGIWFAGAIRPNVDETKRRALSASKLSGDWRTFKGDLELVAMLCVNSPGFPIARGFAASGKQEGLILTGMVPEHLQQLEGLVEKIGGYVDYLQQRAWADEVERMATLAIE